MGIDWWEYETRKKQLPKNLTPREYEKTIQELVKQLETEEKENDTKQYY